MARPYISKKIREIVIIRAKGYCEYCKIPKAYTTKTFEIEHIIPTSKGGESILLNLALACGGCNSFKHIRIEAKDPVSQNTVQLFNPRTQKWEDNFIWSENYISIIGITPTGRATIATLQMNRIELQNLRKVLSLIGEHPPS